MILVKGVIVKTFTSMGATYVYTYSFNTTFRMKENKYKVIIDNVICSSTIGSSFDNKMMLQPHDEENCPYLNKKFGVKCNEVMLSLKNDMQSIVDSYEKTIKSSSNANDGW